MVRQEFSKNQSLSLVGVMFSVFYSVFSVSPFVLIARNTPDAIRKLQHYLDSGRISANEVDEAGYTLLLFAMESERSIKENFVPILLYYGADVRAVKIVRRHNGEEIEANIFNGFFFNQHFIPALAKLLLTYGADCGFQKVINQEVQSNMAWMERGATRYLRLHRAMVQANEYFNHKEYDEAKTQYQEALILLKEFIQEDEQQKGDPVYGYSETYIRNYRDRERDCRERIEQCTEMLQQQKLDEPTTERTPLKHKIS